MTGRFNCTDSCDEAGTLMTWRFELESRSAGWARKRPDPPNPKGKSERTQRHHPADDPNNKATMADAENPTAPPEEEDEEDLEKLQAEIARMEAEAARIAQETEDLAKPTAGAAAGGAAAKGEKEEKVNKDG